MGKKDQRSEKNEDQRKTIGCHRDGLLSYFPIYTPREDPTQNFYYKPTAGVHLILKENI